jgi:putative glutathione S-transferase
MGRLLEGEWRDFVLVGDDERGRWLRQESVFRGSVKADGSSVFKAEPDRYHLYVSLACPWAHRTLIVRKLKKLESVIGVSVVHPLMLEHGWVFSEEAGSTLDEVNGVERLYEIYKLAKPDYTGRVTVPVLWDKRARTIVNNESSEIIRLFNSEFDRYTDSDIDLYPPDLRHEIDTINERIYDNVNDGVYRCGFARAQSAYDTAFDNLFTVLDELEVRLDGQRYLVGSRITEADWRLFVTLVRFDLVYFSHFKCNKRRLSDYPNLWSYTRELYQMAGVAETVDVDHIKRHYYGSQPTINPTRIVPKGPDVDFTLPHDRSRLP